MKKNLILLLCVGVVLAAFASCTPSDEHTHEFADAWSYNETEHWHAASCEHADEKSDSGEHTDSDGNDICDVCGYIQDHTHTYAAELTQGETTHYYASTCGHDVKKDETPHADTNNDGACDVCTYDGGHEHTYAAEWTQGVDTHYHAASCGHDVKSGEESHADADNNAICDVCSYDYGHTHTYADEWSNDDANHWKEVTCGHNVDVGSKSVHTDDDGDGICDVCAYVAEHFHTYETELTRGETTHYYASSCGHDVRKDETAHTDDVFDGVCDVCEYRMYNLYTVTVNAPDYVTVSENIIAKEGTDAIFTVTVPDYAEIVDAGVAVLVGEPEQTDGAYIYTYKVESISADTTITVVANKLEVAILVVEKEETFDMSSMISYDVFSFTVPSAGKYMIYATDHGDVTFGPNVDEDYTHSPIYTFEASEAGEVFVKARCFNFDYASVGSFNYTYVVLQVEDSLTLEKTSGTAKMPANLFLQISFTANEPGLYTIKSTAYSLVWGEAGISTMDNTLVGGNQYIVDVTEAGQLVTFTLYCDDTTTPTFDFDWTIETYDYTDITEETTGVTVPLENYVGFRFTVPNTGSYAFSMGNESSYVYTWNGSSMYYVGSEYIAENVTEGDVIIVYLKVSDDAIIEGLVTEAIEDKLEVKYIGSLVEDGNAVADADGELNYYVNSDTLYEYEFTAPENALLSFDGGETWVSEYITELDAYEIITFLVKTEEGADTVYVDIHSITYEFYLTVGDNTVSMVPDKEYTVTLNGLSGSFYSSAIITWTDANISVTYNGNPIESGTLLNSYSSLRDTLVIVYNGEGTADIGFTLFDATEGADDPDLPDGSGDAILVEGENSFHLTVSGSYCAGIVATFTASEAGTYALNAAEGETNASVIIADDFTSETVDFPYNFTLEAGESIDFHISIIDQSGNYEDDIDIVITKK